MIEFDTLDFQTKLKLLTATQLLAVAKDGFQQGLRPQANQLRSMYKQSFNTQTGFLSWSGYRSELRWGTRFNPSTQSFEGDIFINPQGALKWFEAGTNERLRKNGASTGKLTGKLLFSSNINSAINTASSVAEQVMDQRLQQIFDKF